MMLCLCWDWKGVLYYKLVLENQMIDFNKYSSQLNQLKTTIDENHAELLKDIPFIGDEVKTVITGQRAFYSPAIFAKYYTFRVQLSTVFTKFSWRKKQNIFRKNKKQFFAKKDKILGKRDYKVVWKMAEDFILPITLICQYIMTMWYLQDNNYINIMINKGKCLQLITGAKVWKSQENARRKRNWKKKTTRLNAKHEVATTSLNEYFQCQNIFQLRTNLEQLSWQWSGFEYCNHL